MVAGGECFVWVVVLGCGVGRCGENCAAPFVRFTRFGAVGAEFCQENGYCSDNK